MSNYDDALTAAIAYQTQIAHVKLILRPAIEAARERAKGSKFTFQANDKALLEAGKILGVE